MRPYLFPIIQHSVNYRIETRIDKFGQNVRLHCKCGLITNWHTDHWKAKDAMYDLHSDQAKGRIYENASRTKIYRANTIALDSPVMVNV